MISTLTVTTKPTNKDKMDDAFLTTLSMESNRFSTLLAMDSGSSSHDETERELDLGFSHSGPPDINLLPSHEPSPPPPIWNDACDMLDVGLATHHYETDNNSNNNINVTKAVKKCAKRLDSVWGAWFFFSFYFKPALVEKSKSKMTREMNGSTEYDKADLKLDVFLVQHDMENMYMWVFKERPENALGKMQLRSYMNGHSRQGERPFPFSVDRGFIRSHRMQRKQYRGLSNPQCVHGIELVPSPNLMAIDEDERKKWMELTGRDICFSIPIEASDFGSWRNLPSTDFELDRPPIPLKTNNNNINPHPKRLLNGASLNLSTQSPNLVNGEAKDLMLNSNKRKKNSPLPENSDENINLSPNDTHPDRILDIHPIEPCWLKEFSGVMRCAHGPVTGAKTIYEDDEGFLIVVSLPCVDCTRVKVTWKNTPSHGIVKIACVSIGRVPIIKRQDRVFKLSDPNPEHCPLGEFVREIPLSVRIPEDAKLEAYCDETGTMLEILVPKRHVGPEEHEVRVSLRPSPWSERAYMDFTDALV